MYPLGNIRKTSRCHGTKLPGSERTGDIAEECYTSVSMEILLSLLVRLTMKCGSVVLSQCWAPAGFPASLYTIHYHVIIPPYVS